MSMEEDIGALIGSRICHDLISPLGAIGNGLELLSMGGSSVGPEMALISESVENANARIRFFRVAYGAAATGARLGRPEIASILSAITRGGRLVIDWQVEGDLSRGAVKLAFLALQCLENAMPYGGRIVVSRKADGWLVHGTANKMKVDMALWTRLSGTGEAAIAPAQVQFALLPEEAARQGLRLSVDLAEGAIVIGW